MKAKILLIKKLQRRLKGNRNKNKEKIKESLGDDSLCPSNLSRELDSLQDCHRQERKERDKEL